jgi:uroporphyrinogen decarboxylase
VLFHSCGAIREIIPDVIDLGADILNPIQVRAKGMVPAELKKNYGDKLTFHGSVDIQKTLPFGSVEDVRNEVMERIKVLAPGGGFILAPTHNFQPGTPLENILALYETALHTRRYRNR